MASYKILNGASMVDFANGKTLDGITLTPVNPKIGNINSVGTESGDVDSALTYLDAQGWVLFQAVPAEADVIYILKHA